MAGFIDVVKLCFISEGLKDVRGERADYDKCTELFMAYILLELLRGRAGAEEIAKEILLELGLPDTSVETVVEIIMYPERFVEISIPKTLIDAFTEVLSNIVDIPVLVNDNYLDTSDKVMDTPELVNDNYLETSDAVLSVPSTSIEIEVR